MGPRVTGLRPDSVEAVVLAGGMGTRLKEVVADVPKPLAPVCGRPFLTWLLHNLSEQGVNRTILAVGYKAPMIVDVIGNRWNGMDISYSFEESPLGTGGAIRHAVAQASEPDLLILNGDTFLEVNLKNLMKYHQNSHRKLTVVTSDVEDATRYGSVKISLEAEIIGFYEKGKSGIGKINGGIYVADIDMIAELKNKNPFSFEKEILKMNGPAGRLGSFHSSGMFIDIGIPEDYSRAQSLFSSR